MLRGYRLAIIALGLTLAGAALGQEESKDLHPIPIDRPANQGEQTQETPNTNERAAEPVYRVRVMRDEGEAVAAEKQQRIENERANEDLDAQRRMADSADDLVKLTLWQLLIAAAGTALVIWNLVLARSSNEAAVKGADAAATGAEIARQTMIADKRAWIVIRSVRLVGPTSFKPDLIDIVLEVEVENIGATPATSAAVETAHVPRRSDDEDGAFMKEVRKFTGMLRAMPSQIGNTFFPQSPRLERHRWPITKDQFEGAVHTLENGPVVVGIGILVGVRYRIVGDDKPHITFQPYSALNIPVGFTLPHGESFELSPMPFIPGEVD